MTRTLLVSSVAALIFSGAGPLLAAEGEKHWGYEGEGGPAAWGEIAAEYHMCSEGRSQSPVNLESEVDADLPELVFEYHSSSMKQVNNGHTIQQNVAPGSFLRVPALDKKFEVKQFHFHSPSEHQVNGKSYAMEMHIVHANEQGELAVVGVLFEEGEKNEELEKLWAVMPEKPGEQVEQAVVIEETKLMPPTRDYYYYSGSLTTPPCSEGVAWIVLKTPVEASPQQVAAFKARVGSTTNRPVQHHNARIVLD